MMRTPFACVLLASMLFFGSCPGKTLPPPPGTIGPGTTWAPAITDWPELGVGEIAIRDLAKREGATVEIGAFWKASATVGILKDLELLGKCAEVMRTLRDALFSGYSIITPGKGFREARIGGFLPEGRALVFVCSGLDPKSALATPGALALVEIKVNAFFGEGPGRDMLKELPFEVAGNRKAWRFALYPGGRLVALEDISDGDTPGSIAPDSGGVSVMETVNLSDRYIHDQDGANDGMVPGLLLPGLAGEVVDEVDAEFKSYLAYQLFLYKLLIGDLEGGREWLTKAKAFARASRGLSMISLAYPEAAALLELME